MTGVQTCALPICAALHDARGRPNRPDVVFVDDPEGAVVAILERIHPEAVGFGDVARGEELVEPGERHQRQRRLQVTGGGRDGRTARNYFQSST